MNEAQIAAIDFLQFIQTEYKVKTTFDDYNWRQFSLEKKEKYFVLLRSALEYCLRNPTLDESSIEYLYATYMQVFEFLANNDSRLKNALEKGIHAYFMGDRPEVVQAFKRLIRQPTEVK